MSVVRTEVRERVGVVTLDDPGRRNAMSLAMAAAVDDAFDRLESSTEVGAVVVTGAPPSFCAGADLSELGDIDREALEQVYAGFLRVARCPLPTVAAVNGPAVGAGLNLALVCDLRVAARSARFDSRFLSIALHPGGGHTWMLRHAVGGEAAAAMLLFGETLDGEAAVRHGLAWRCVDDGDEVDEAVRLASRAASAPGELTRRLKSTLRKSYSISDHAQAIEHELETQLWSMVQPEFAERLDALRRRIGTAR